MTNLMNSLSEMGLESNLKKLSPKATLPQKSGIEGRREVLELVSFLAEGAEFPDQAGFNPPGYDVNEEIDF